MLFTTTFFCGRLNGSNPNPNPKYNPNPQARSTYLRQTPKESTSIFQLDHCSSLSLFPGSSSQRSSAWQCTTAAVAAAADFRRAVRRVKDSRKMRKNDSLTSRERTSSAQADKSQEKAVLKGTFPRLTRGTSSGRIRSESPPSLIVRSANRLGRKSPSGEHQVPCHPRMILSAPPVDLSRDVVLIYRMTPGIPTLHNLKLIARGKRYNSNTWTAVARLVVQLL